MSAKRMRYACSVLRFTWGLLGAGAAEDETVLRQMFDYHTAWFNMIRGHDGSFVVQPGRDYADGGYYIASRYNPTAAMVLALIYIVGIVAAPFLPETVGKPLPA